MLPPSASSTPQQTVILTRHPATPSRAVRGIEVQVGGVEGSVLALTFRLDADMARVRIPPLAAQRRAPGLWQHTCFEAFLAPVNSQAYYELNFSPSGQWAAYAFRAYRDGASDALEAAPQIGALIAPDRLELGATVDLSRLNGLQPHGGLRLALSAVIEEEGLTSYWALKHPAANPDFHHPDAFALTLELPARETDEQKR